MTAFADSSALVKLYADEEGCEDVRALTHLVVAQIARVEVPAALWRKTRVGELPPGPAAVLVAAFEADLFGTADEAARFAVVGLSPAVLDDAARLAGTHALRAYDAVQLASARAAAAADPGLRRFAAFDPALCRAAAAEGFTLVI
ncbi:type II toxin-antitoxin system VapC family toxin [Pseudonocardia nematodicida]|uniref:Type II toxin-antitoxin system VapC family toxin n=1 Tax=Pseudonocardia nematodicida TaxID=1206997 RepID=A0ABV1KES0_9PSEU